MFSSCISTPSGTVIIPVSKISMGIASGGLDYLGKNEEAVKSKLQNFGGELGWTRAPNKEELRCMTFLALNHGIKGIAYFKNATYKMPLERQFICKI